MLGLVMCGGKSSRMGNDKGLLRSETTTWVQKAASTLAGLSLPVKISVNKEQYANYSSLFLPADLIIDDPSLQLRGPLYGVLSAHLQFPSQDLFILACDMPLMEIAILNQLSHLYHTHPDPNAFVFTNDGEPEPLCGIYRSAGLAKIIAMYHAQQLAKHSMKFMLEHINTFTVPIPAENKPFFRNFNAHAELNGL